MNYFTHSQISNFDFSLLSNKNVLQFNISVNDAHLVQIF